MVREKLKGGTMEKLVTILLKVVRYFCSGTDCKYYVESDCILIRNKIKLLCEIRFFNSVNVAKLEKDLRREYEKVSS